MSIAVKFHSIERTSPKGEGEKFIGTCRLCGRSDLTLANMNEPCENRRGLTSEEALIEAIGTGDSSNIALTDGGTVQWRNDAFEKSAQIVERWFGEDAAGCAANIRQLIKTGEKAP